MNLGKLYKMQEELDNHILEKHNLKMSKEELLDNTILALLVEVGELANETRCFKHWSTKGPNNRQAIQCRLCDGTGDANYHNIMEAAESNMKHDYIKCEECEGTGIIGYKNPILEELADVWHFYLSIGNQIGVKIQDCFSEEHSNNVTQTFLSIYFWGRELEINNLTGMNVENAYKELGSWISILWNKLNFTDKEAERAYLKKHEENYRRQREGY